MGSDENLEIVFWWVGDDPQASIEDELDEFLEDEQPPRPRRHPWRTRRRRTIA